MTINVAFPNYLWYTFAHNHISWELSDSLLVIQWVQHSIAALPVSNDRLWLNWTEINHCLAGFHVCVCVRVCSPPSFCKIYQIFTHSIRECVKSNHTLLNKTVHKYEVKRWSGEKIQENRLNWLPKWLISPSSSLPPKTAVAA